MKKYYFTFGDYGDDTTRNRCQCVIASCEMYARTRIFEIYGDQFCTSYTSCERNRTIKTFRSRFGSDVYLDLEDVVPTVLRITDRQAEELINSGVFDRDKNSKILSEM